MLEDAVKEERKKAEEMVKQTLEMTKKEMDNYVQQRLKVRASGYNFIPAAHFSATQCRS